MINHMDVKSAYNIWAEQYDSNNNKTRDLEAKSLRTTLSDIDFKSCLELGCGTGKNTEWLLDRTTQITAVDFSETMLAEAKKKIISPKITYVNADINKNWDFAWKQYDLITFSLVLEHIEHLESIFLKASQCIAKNGYLYIGELHPYKQYEGTKARFETEEGLQIVDCFNHNFAEFTQCGKLHGFEVIYVNELFDNDDEKKIPRILTILFKKLKQLK
jgi:ubiquinone/menaquinone biosynthesis C-methylase UbiE